MGRMTQGDLIRAVHSLREGHVTGGSRRCTHGLWVGGTVEKQAFPMVWLRWEAVNWDPP